MMTNWILRRLWRPVGAIATLAMWATPASAQVDDCTGWSDPLAPGYLYRASAMLTTGNPNGTIDQMAAIAADTDALTPEMNARRLALKGASLFERGDQECLAVLTLLAESYPTSPLATQALLTIGDWYWFHADWHEAIEAYTATDIKALAGSQRNLYSYRLALAYLHCGLREEAAGMLAQIAGDPAFDVAARYYSAYIDYLEGDYDKAYEEMSRLEASAQEGMEPLYYMAQIEYLKGRYDDVIRHTSALIRNHPVDELLPEAHRIAGLSHFKKGDLENARPHLQQYLAATQVPDDDAAYAMGCILYRDGDQEEAERLLTPLTDRNNAIAQGAYLYLGQIAEQRGDHNAAAMAFGKASAMAFDRNVAETALYNHITALTRGGSAPFASSITMLEDFLKRYPESPYASEVEESLASAFFHESDYPKALAAIEKVTSPGEATLATKQKILYKLGTGELSAGQTGAAARHLREAAEMKGQDPGLAAESRLWLAEALYSDGNWKGAAAAYQAALNGNLTPENRASARYGLAYSLFKGEDWKNALKAFASVAEDKNATTALRSDALVREADCLLYMGLYEKAASGYQLAMKASGSNADYAAFRHAVTTGVISGTEPKMKELNAFLRDRKGSRWTSEVLLEAGKTMAALERPDKAAQYFERLTKEFPKDTRSRSGALSLALAYMKQGETAKAENIYKEIIRQWPTSEEAQLANEDMRRLCAKDNRLPEYAEFLAGIPGAPQIDADEMDGISFEAAETAYADNPANTAALEKYIRQFPDGRYLPNALMDLAEAADAAGEQKKALTYLDRLLSSRGDSPQAPAALFLQAQIHESLGDRSEALTAYRQLEQRGGAEFAPEATSGIMRTTTDADERTTYARRVLRTGGALPEATDDARFHEAAGMLHGKETEKGEAALKTLAASPDNLSGAKAAVELGEWYLEKGDTAQALKTLEAFTDAGSVHSYWLARGFIALADAYHADGNDYLASEYLRSLQENYPGDEADIREAISTRLERYSK
ncbi:MAG: tetratricopeptide repeat protein [Muribaculaceae bacterium]|nr:tetratricopeptide repeat protein [Muribaculaceae bacterium]